MQPYFLPYIGYFQLIAAVDLFVVYDDIKYTKKGWINRNRMLQNGAAAVFSLPLKHDSHALEVREREIAPDFNRRKMLSRFEGAYRNAPYFAVTFPVIEQIVRYQDVNLFHFLHHSLGRICEHLQINTRVVISSTLNIDENATGEEKVLALCAAVGAGSYVNAIGGVDLYSKETFRDRGVELEFIQSKSFEYPQFGNAFVPWLSIIDVMMFNPPDAIQRCISTNYELI